MYLATMLETFEKSQLFVKKSKGHLISKIEYLGHLISKDRVRDDPKKLGSMVS